MRRVESSSELQPKKIALISNDALGNYAAINPLAQMLKSTWPAAELSYFSGSRVGFISERTPLFDHFYPVLGEGPRFFGHFTEKFNLVINVENTAMAKSLATFLCADEGFLIGPCVAPDGRGDLPFESGWRGELWEDKEWISPDIHKKYEAIHTGFIGELFARLAYQSGPIPQYQMPKEDPGEVPDVLMATAASLDSKLWPIENWIRLVKKIADRGLTVGLIGAKPSDQGKFWKGASDEDRLVTESPIEDLRGVFSLTQVVGALDKANFVVTLDNGILHFACSTQTPTIGIFRNGIHRLWAPPVPNLVVVEPGPGRKVSEISVEEVFKQLTEFQIPLGNF